MSRANSVVKVLRVALKRVQTRWGQGSWSQKDTDGTYRVCLEGAITGGCTVALTPQQQEAKNLCLEIIKEKYAEAGNINGKYLSIPFWNDNYATQEEVEEIIKLAIIREETGGSMDPEENYIDDEELAFLVE